MDKTYEGNRAFCKTFSDGSHLTLLWNKRRGIFCDVPEDLWSLPHDQASEFLRRLAEGRPTTEDHQIMEDAADVIRAVIGRDAE
ncbi:MAG: hypothetical protein ACOYD9_03875 [Pyramidobacter sp.]